MRHRHDFPGRHLLPLAVGSLLFASDLAAVDFTRDIRPILNTQCAHCHGSDEENRESEFRVDTKAGVFSDLGGYSAFVPGSPAESEALRRITSDDPDERMPPPDSGKSLSAAEIQLLRQWIEDGATWQDHWAYVAPRRPSVPRVRDSDWCRNPLDAFVLARLEAAGLQPSPAADRTTLLRRLSLDLVGLPPTVAELDAFLAEDLAAGYRQQVERLLKSPHYGERWARIWLDAARYADSDGFEKDKPRSVWMYRDYVINAHNRDLPYDRFIVEQIAGDLLPNPTQDQLVATGFLRNSMLNEEGGIDPEQFRMEAMFDRMDAIGKAILGVTLQCGQCHNHKYDPLTQTDYYRMFALLNNSHEANITVFAEDARRQREQILTEIETIEAQLRARDPDWQRHLTDWADFSRAEQPQWHPLAIEHTGDNGQRYLAQPDQSLLAQGYAPTRHDAVFRAESDLAEIRSFRIEALRNPNLPAGGPGRSIDGLFALTEFKVEVASVQTPQSRKWVTFTRAAADASNEERELAARYADKEGNRKRTGPVAFAIDGDEETAWGVDLGPGRRNRPRQAVFVADANLAQLGGTILTIHLVQKHGGWNSDDNQNLNLGRFRLSVAGEPALPAGGVLPPLEVAQLLETETAGWRDQDWKTAFAHWRTQVPAWQAANDQIETLWRQHPEGTTQLVYAERQTMRPTHQLARGDFLLPEKQVAPGVPAFLHPLETQTPTRLDLARWLVDRQSPTTARAIVNRVWQAYFGSGLVSTSEDLGVQGEPPTHPQLLDWLAVEFMESGWSLKHLHRLIVQSQTYQQSSHVTPGLLERDPANRLLARGARFRVDAELVRDISLAASGLLNRKVGGPSVFPPAPEFLFQPPASYGPKTWQQETGPDRYRRALYTFRFRSTPFPALQVFDAPNGDTSCVRRVRSNTPLQALVTMNEPLFVECAKALAGRTLAEGGADDEQRVAFAFRQCLGRHPSDVESRVLLELLSDSRQQLSVSQTAVASLAASAPQAAELFSGESEGGELEWAAWTLVSRVILNLDETLTRE